MSKSKIYSAAEMAKSMEDIKLVPTPAETAKLMYEESLVEKNRKLMKKEYRASESKKRRASAEARRAYVNSGEYAERKQKLLADVTVVVNKLWADYHAALRNL